MKLLTVVGARPQFVKASVLSRLIKNDNSIEDIIVHTGQHFDLMMSDIFFRELDIPEPKYNLDINSLSHGAMTGRMLEQIEQILKNENIDIVIVYGDTNSTLAGALAASKLHIPIAHIEAGLRSFNNLMPEETNRKLTDHISDYCFCPTDNAVNNLIKEGISKDKIYQVGDIMYDNFLTFMDLIKEYYSVRKSLKVKPKSYCLLTLHREENTKNFNMLNNLFNCLNGLGYPFIFPVHPRLNKFLASNNFPYEKFKNITFISPLSYFDMIDLEINSKIIFTDSGGVQKEAYWCKVPCITLREETEWVELIDIGVNKTVGLNTTNIIIAFTNFMNQSKFSFDDQIYGDGKSGQKILDVLLK